MLLLDLKQKSTLCMTQSSFAVPSEASKSAVIDTTKHPNLNHKSSTTASTTHLTPSPPTTDASHLPIFPSSGVPDPSEQQFSLFQEVFVRVRVNPANLNPFFPLSAACQPLPHAQMSFLALSIRRIDRIHVARLEDPESSTYLPGLRMAHLLPMGGTAGPGVGYIILLLLWTSNLITRVMWMALILLQA